MRDQTYDLLIIGGGIAGASLAGAVAKQGAKVVVLESEPRFKDRVRGEAIMPWGVADARALGIYDVLVSAGAIPITYWDTYQGAERSGHRNIVNTAPLKEHILDCYHPAMQEALLQWAQDSGASVKRPDGMWFNPTPYLRSRIAFSISAWRRWSASSSRGSPSRSVMKP